MANMCDWLLICFSFIFDNKFRITETLTASTILFTLFLRVLAFCLTDCKHRAVSPGARIKVIRRV